MSPDKPKLAAVPEPEPETDEQETETPAPTYTLADQVKRNVQLIRELADEYDVEPAVVATMFQTTMHVHFTKMQLGLAAPAEA